MSAVTRAPPTRTPPPLTAPCPVPSPHLPAHRTRGPAGIALLLAALLAGCATTGPRPGEVDVRPRAPAASAALPGAAQPPAQCVPEGQPCDAPGAVCCPNTTCAGIGRPVCIHAY